MLSLATAFRRTSYEQQNWGTEVSYADAQPGDLICYGGHVAIYMGNGQIVHASNSRDGIKISNNAAYRTIPFCKKTFINMISGQSSFGSCFFSLDF